MSPPDELKRISQEIKATGEDHKVSPRQIISWYGAQRRGRWISRQIKEDLRSLSLTTYPDFETAYIDEVISLCQIGQSEAAEAPDPEDPQKEAINSGIVADPVARIRMLEAANRPPLSVKRDESLTTAITLMLMNDYSQLPVLSNERSVDGMVSWRSIGRAQALGRKAEFVRDCMEEAFEIRNDMPLLEAIVLITKHEVVLVRERDRRIVGLVTTSDLSLEFLNLAEPFLLIGEIENHLRRLIDGKLPREALVTLKVDPDSGRQISNVTDLNFGEYIRLLQNRDNWSLLSLNLDRSKFCDQLDRIRAIRNDVMHFSPDGILKSDLEALRDFVRFLQHLRSS